MKRVGRKIFTVFGGAVIMGASFWITTIALNYGVSTGSSSGPSTVIGIQFATYGANCNAPAGNATSDVQKICGGKKTCDYSVDVGKLNDPAPGCPKDIIVQYSCGANKPSNTAMVAGESNGKLVHLSCP